MAAAANVGAAWNVPPGMLEATSAIDFTSKLEDLRRKYPQVKVPPDAWTWSLGELDAYFTSGGKKASERKEAPKAAAQNPATKPMTPQKRTSSEALGGYEIQEALQLQNLIQTELQTPEWQDQLKSLQQQHPERKTKGHYDSTAFYEAFQELVLSVFVKVLPTVGLKPDWDGVREMNSKMIDALVHPKVKKVQEEINVLMGLPRNAQFSPPSKGAELFVYRPFEDGPVPGFSKPLVQDVDGDEAHEFLVEDEETGELKVVGPTSLVQEQWYMVTYKPAVVIREQPDEKAKMVGRKKAGKKVRAQMIKDGKWLQLHHSELAKLGVQEAWLCLDPVEAGLPEGTVLLEKTTA